MKTEPVRIILGYILICLIWGTTWLAIKLGLESVPAFLSAAIRFGIAVAVLGALIRVQGLHIPFDRNARRVYAILAGTSFSIPFVLIYWGQQHVASGMSAILFAVYPFLVALNSSLFLRSEKLTRWKMAGIALGFTGIVVLFVRDIRLDGPFAFLGACAIVGSAFLQAMSVVFLKKYAAAISSTVMNFMGMLAGGLVLLVFSLVFESRAGIVWSAKAVGSILYLGIFGSVVTFNTYFWLLKRVDTVILSLSALVTPVIAVVAGVLILGEHFSPDMAVGSFLVLLGLLTANAEGLRALRGTRTDAG